MKAIDINLNYYKQGDDLKHHLKNNSITEAFLKHAEQMQGVVENLNAIADLIEEYGEEGVEVEGDTHCIEMTCPDKVADKMVEMELGVEPME